MRKHNKIPYKRKFCATVDPRRRPPELVSIRASVVDLFSVFLSSTSSIFYRRSVLISAPSISSHRLWSVVNLLLLLLLLPLCCRCYWSALCYYRSYCSYLSSVPADGSKTPAAPSGVVASANTNARKATKAPLQRKDSSPVAASEKRRIDRLMDKDRKKNVPHPQMQFDDKNRVEKVKKCSVVTQTEIRNRVELFRHL